MRKSAAPKKARISKNASEIIFFEKNALKTAKNEKWLPQNGGLLTAAHIITRKSQRSVVGDAPLNSKVLSYALPPGNALLFKIFNGRKVSSQNEADENVRKFRKNFSSKKCKNLRKDAKELQRCDERLENAPQKEWRRLRQNYSYSSQHLSRSSQTASTRLFRALLLLLLAAAVDASNLKPNVVSARRLDLVNVEEMIARAEAEEARILRAVKSGELLIEARYDSKNLRDTPQRRQAAASQRPGRAELFAGPLIGEPMRDSVKCFSCMSKIYEAVWPALAPIYKRPLNFTDACNFISATDVAAEDEVADGGVENDGDAAASSSYLAHHNSHQQQQQRTTVAHVPVTQCSTICVGMWEETNVAGVKIRAHIRGCLDDLLHNGFNETIVALYRWMQRDSCRDYRKRELFKLAPQRSDDSTIHVCTCYANHCNAGADSGGARNARYVGAQILVLSVTLVVTLCASLLAYF